MICRIFLLGWKRFWLSAMETTKSYKKYIRLYGPHFTKDLAEFAAGLMWDDKKESPSYTK